VVALRIERSAAVLSGPLGPPALDYLEPIQSGASESNREPRAPKARVLPFAPPPDNDPLSVARVGVEPNLIGLKNR
jgi:hypothetical protein